VDTSGNHNVTTTTFAAVDTTNLRVALTTTASGVVLVTFNAPVAANGGTQIFLSLQVDTGGAVGGANGITGTISASYLPLTMQWVFTGLSAASHNFDVMARVGSSSGDVGISTSFRSVLTAIQLA
jgi:hypothetical protein